MADALKNWLMVALTLIFVALYTAALTGWLRPLADVTMITRLEPVIFVIIGYYFGRLPAQANEKTLKDEIDRQAKRTDAFQHAKEVAEKERNVLEEKTRNAQIVLKGDDVPSARTITGALGRGADKLPDAFGKPRNATQTAIAILES